MRYSDPTDREPGATRLALLQAAGVVFADRGFRAATVREICRKAGTNVAAVNYHFGDKARLYLEVLRYVEQKKLQAYPLTIGLPDHPTGLQRLHAFVRSLLLRVFDGGPMSWTGRLVFQELVEPTAALDAMVDEQFRPLADYLTTILQELAGPDATPELIRWCGCSIVSQCVFYHHCRSAVCKLFPEQQFSAPVIERLALHIVEFTLGGLERLTGRKLPPVEPLGRPQA